MGRPAALVFAGGMGLGAYHLGAVEALLGRGIDPVAVAGTSIGAVTAAIVAGSPAEQVGPRLAAFWDRVAVPPLPLPGRKLRAASGAAMTRLGGAPGLFQWRALPNLGASSLYDHAVLADTLADLVDFARIGDPIRCCLVATDARTGEAVRFDTAAGAAITPAHVLASGAMPPSLPAVEIGGQAFFDGGLTANLPLEAVLASDAPAPAPPLVILHDLFAADGSEPDTLETANARAVELQFAGQTTGRLAAIARERALLARLGEVAAVDVLWLSYRAPPHEAGSERQFDFSAETIADRCAAGAADAEEAMRLLDALAPIGEGQFRVTKVRRPIPTPG